MAVWSLNAVARPFALISNFFWFLSDCPSKNVTLMPSQRSTLISRRLSMSKMVSCKGLLGTMLASFVERAPANPTRLISMDFLEMKTILDNPWVDVMSRRRNAPKPLPMAGPIAICSCMSSGRVRIPMECPFGRRRIAFRPFPRKNCRKGSVKTCPIFPKLIFHLPEGAGMTPAVTRIDFDFRMRYLHNLVLFPAGTMQKTRCKRLRSHTYSSVRGFHLLFVYSERSSSRNRKLLLLYLFYQKRKFQKYTVRRHLAAQCPTETQ
jgi:hypothetical protein